MKKRLLFIAYRMNSDGANKSLLSLLSQINYNIYEVDLFLFEHVGTFMDQLPVEVNLLPFEETVSSFKIPLKKSCAKLLQYKDWKYIIPRICFSIEPKIRTLIYKKEDKHYSFKYYKFIVPQLKGDYYAAIAYVEGLPIEILIDKVRAKKKIGWIHTDYIAADFNKKHDIKYFKKLDNIVTISRKCKESLDESFPKFKSKTLVINNIVSPQTVNNMAQQAQEGFSDNFDGIRILTVGRLSYEKGIDLSIQACSHLVQNNYDIRWYIIGEGPEEDNIRNMIQQNKLEDKVYLLGAKSNPYPYMNQCNIYVQPSRYEGKSIAIEEAKILCKPIVVTNYNSVTDQIINGVNGVIVNQNNRTDKELYKGIKQILDDSSFKNDLINNLRSNSYGNEREVEKFYELIR